MAPNPGRILHDAAEDLLDELTERYAVDRRETKEPFDGNELLRTVRLMPRHPAAGPLAVVFNGDPGVVLRLGRWFAEPLPGADDPARSTPDLVADLRVLAAAHVEGGLWERIRRGVSGSLIETRLIGPGFESTREAPVDSAEARAARREGFAAPVRWAPWPRRAG
ncbi:DUF6226 family protein [Symbioplanes lichenis]|uniref:DUF6226 family protein n=1 Tax=Symbioplanes lichenis TaxID=1629072 RepID=UPI0027392D49|nr:DUF6226 family protein [Actinoplanes lichenis]